MKKLLMTLLTGLTLLVMTACGTADTEDQASSDNPENGTSEVAEENNDAVDENEASEETETNDAAETEDQATTENDREVITEETTFNGVVDTHSIEVQNESDVLVLQTLDPGVADIDFQAVEAGTPVIIHYYQNENDQNILTEFEIQ
ncbi:hypothetical protein [Robertmurraya massiliosenegalensis]|uniref:hypothetical protein n=1 Tax=Robertmurraya massiliosenegalensis TaxID=1287657 RepID=UPI0002D432BD|nr:hypothetical protein [Robertmurraya massiliosenegalensis]